MDASSSTVPMTITMVILIPIIGILMAITPYLMKKSECFAVTIPENGRTDPYLNSLKKRYTAIVLVITLVLTVAGIFFSIADNSFAVILVMIVGTLLICIGSYVLMLYFRQKVRLYKKQQNWVADQQESVAVIADTHIPQAISLRWNLLYLPVVLITLAIGYAGYGSIPDQIAMQIGFDGQVTRWVDKTPLIIWLPVIIQAFMAGAFVFSHWTITRSKRASDPGAPTTSALAYGMFAHAQSIFTLVAGLLFCGLMTTMPLEFMGVMTLLEAAVILVIGCFVIVIGALALSIVYGQGGSRLFRRMQSSDTILADDDQYWKLGIFYYNPEDPSLFLLERFGIGWTVNWARPAIWAIMVGGLVITIVFITVVMLMA